MCGIAGILSKKQSRNFLELFSRRASKILEHRGPDDSGNWINDNTALIHRRLSIIDLSKSGHQPMFSSCRRYILVFNGEIYNHKALRKQLEIANPNIIWSGTSDTEVVLAAINFFGLIKAVTKFEGMFSIGLLDRSQHKLHLIRDRAGEKPLYYGIIDNDLVFGSELKVFKAHPGFKGEINSNALHEFIRLSYVPDNMSIFKNIGKVQPSEIVTIDTKTFKFEKSYYWTLIKDDRFKGLSDIEMTKRIDTRLQNIISNQIVADVNVGAYLSGGIDSSIVSSIMQYVSTKKINTFSIGFNESMYDESKDAKKVASFINSKHFEIILSSDDLAASIDYMPKIFDEPFADSSQIPTFLISKFAKSHVSVVLTGDGGDEIFGGYNRHVWTNGLWRKTRNIPPVFLKLFSKILTTPSQERWNMIYSFLEIFIAKKYRMRLPGEKIYKIAKALSCSTTNELYRFLTSSWLNVDGLLINKNSLIESFNNDNLDDTESIMYRDFKEYLPGDILTKVDRASMSVSLETRAPFLDHNLIEDAWNLPMHMKIRHGNGKYVLKEILKKYIPNYENKPKMGFGVPIDSWLRGPLKSFTTDVLNEKEIINDAIFDFKTIDKLLKEHFSGRYNHHHKIWNLIMFQLWMKKFYE